MCTTKIRVILCILLCCLGQVVAQTTVPKVRADKHALLDVYLFADGTAQPPIYLNSLIDSKCTQLLPLGGTVGVGVGFHMPNKWSRYMLRTGYHYQNFTYIGSYNEKGLSCHYLDVDARALLFNALMVGVKTDILLSQSLPSSLPQEYLGFCMDIFSPAVLTPYLGASLPVTSNFSIELTTGYQVIYQFNTRQVKKYMMEDIDVNRIASYSFELGFYYRIFTTGKRKTWGLRTYK